MPGGELSQQDIDKLLGVPGGEGEGSKAAEEGEVPAAAPGAAAAEAGAPAAAPEAARESPGKPPGPVSPEKMRSAFALLEDVPLNVRIELGRTRMYVEEILKLDKGSVVEIDKLAGDPMDILVNDRLVAKGELIVLDDCFCIRVTEIVSPENRREQESQ